MHKEKLKPGHARILVQVPVDRLDTSDAKIYVDKNNVVVDGDYDDVLYNGEQVEIMDGFSAIENLVLERGDCLVSQEFRGGGWSDFERKQNINLNSEY